jgi:hypothetical protein
MASAYSQAINKLKYADLFARLTTWKNPQDVWVKNAGNWVEPKEVYAKNGGVWSRVTHEVRFLKFDGTAYLSCGDEFNNYTSAATAYHEFKIVLTSLAAVQTLFSYGADITYCTIEIGTDGKVSVRTRYNSGGAYVLTHASVLAINTLYTIYVSVTNDSTPLLSISIHDAAGSHVGTDVSTGTFSRTLNTSIKYIGQKYNATNRFTGYLLDLRMFGGTYGGSDQTFDANELLSSTIGSTTIVDSNSPAQNLTGTNVAVAATG